MSIVNTSTLESNIKINFDGDDLSLLFTRNVINLRDCCLLNGQ